MIRFLLLTVAAAAAGVAQFASYQPTGLWWAAPLGFALFFVVVGRVVSEAPGDATGARHVRRWVMWLSWVQGLVCYLFLLPWVGEYVGAIAWIGLALLESLYSLLFGLGLGLLCVAVRSRRGSGGTVLLLVAVPAWFVATEWLRSSWPFGGFGWARVAWGQVAGPLAEWTAVAGPALVTFAVVLTGLALALLVRRRYVTAVSTVAVTVGGGLVLGAVPTSWGGDVDETLNVVAVQGNVPRLGLDFNSQRAAVLNNHLAQTFRLAEEIDRGERPRPDVVIWPENASDINPFTSESAAEQISAAAEAVGAPLLVGTLTEDEVGSRNTAVVWDPESGPGDQHVKKFLQPFGEYMPYRDLLRHVSPYVDMAGDFKAGDGDGVVDMDGVPVGVATCYEVSFDGAFRDAVRAGATLFASPTNNATFGFTDMTFQQLAISRMRAIEYDRSVIVAATSGVSAIVAPDGGVTDRTEIFRAGLLQEDVPVRDTETLSARVGPVGEWILTVVGAAVVFYAGFRQKKR
ncbi:apolipoprotein N-acyltransferase [Corynebacterium sp.]|uniref:apolipoprotein N-acyltransferase n=1 Tax=Corynebacterium sp. TaxID=1720 RepID=UPI0025B7E550|nr:apolipoprotein N-acyltransferase [Corynebacterium sp.]